ncbi:MAG: hypothetical protein JNM77_12675 [Pseudonocardia sp.]|nr:hypothetical protein [Pseudonocardia sp.]
MSDPSISTTEIVVTIDGKRQRITRTPGPQDGTVVERWPDRGLVFSERAWLGTHWAKSLRWSAAINAGGRPFEATERAEGFTSRRAAVRWLIAHAG